MGDANAAYADGDFERAQQLLHTIIETAPKVPAPYRTLGMRDPLCPTPQPTSPAFAAANTRGCNYAGLIFEQTGDTKRAVEAFMMAAHFTPKDPEQWRRIAIMAQCVAAASPHVPTASRFV